MNLRQILNEAEARLQKSKIDDFEYDATEILLNLLDMDKARFLFECEQDLESMYDKRSISNLVSEYDELINARSSHFPLQYILGESYFCGLKFLVNQDVLIPRQDTETLVETVLSENPDKNTSILDLCTGSGCIAISLARLGDYKIVVGSDISHDALTVAAKNAEELLPEYSFDDEMNQQIYFVMADIFDGVEKLYDKVGVEKFDIITANPPYIKSKVLSTLQDEVKKYEPKIALDGDKDGLKYYKRIAKDAKSHLTDKGKIYLEIGYDQASDVKEIFEKEGYKHIETIKDLGGNDRVIVFSI